MGMNIAIVGMSPSANDAPFGKSGWECWGMPWHPDLWVMFDRVFEMHDLSHEDLFNDAYIEKLKGLEIPLYMQEAYFENATQYPFDDIGTDYFSSSIGYMMALAIKENPSCISIYGVDMADDTEYRHQRPNLEYLIGLARGKGIIVNVHESSPVMKFKSNVEGHGYTTRYGWTQ